MKGITPTRLFRFFAALTVLFAAAPQVVNAQYAVLHNFADGTQPLDGADPGPTLTVTPNGIFGATASGYSTKLPGFTHQPTVFNLSADGSVLIIHDFPHAALVPNCPLLYHNNAFFGTTLKGPASSPYGVVFRLREEPDKSVWRSALLHKFDSDQRPQPMYPHTSVIVGADGDLYGTTMEGGSSDQGTIYRLNLTSLRLEILYKFGGATGYPTSLMLAADGNYYGTTGGTIVSSGKPVGTIFEMTPAGKVTVLYTTAEGIYFPLVQANDGNFYGTISDSVIRMTPEYAVTVIFTFPQGGGGGNGLVEGPTGNLYGTSYYGGTANHGTIFELATDGSSYQVLHNFGDGSVSNDGLYPAGALVVGSDNNLYGTTSLGGTNNSGTIFKVSP
jgi:uncharacterized repeat protein (TIGR03803 family)